MQKGAPSDAKGRLAEAVNLGLGLLASHFSKVEALGPGDFDEDDDPGFRPEPLYLPIVLPLPLLSPGGEG